MRNEGVMGSALNTVDSPEGTRCAVVVIVAVVAVVVLMIVLAAVLTLSNGIIRYCGAVMAALGAATGEVVARPDGSLAVLSIMRKCGAAAGAAVRSAAVLIVVGVDSVVLAII